MSSTSKLPTFPSKPRVIILSDISHEPDDAESLVRYLTYANQFDTEGLVAVTSTWLRDVVRPEEMVKIIEAYGKTVDNLNAHVHPYSKYPSAAQLKSVVRKGAATYGLSALNEDNPLSPGAQLILSRMENADPRPLWILVWGGTADLAHALVELTDRHNPGDCARIRSRLRIYAISDQDDSAFWIRTNFPDIFYICSVHGWSQYGLAAWTGISGEQYYGFDAGGPDPSKWTREWVKAHIQIGALGSAYPDPLSIPESATPSFLYLIQNGLSDPEHPEYGSWGGRYIQTDPSPPTDDMPSNNHYSDAVDRVRGANGNLFVSNHATIWRWRAAFQNDFAARVHWSTTPDFRAANHHPVIWLNDTTGLEPVKLEAEAGSTITLDASRTYDPDAGQTLAFEWFHYAEPSTSSWHAEREIGKLIITPLDSQKRKVEVRIPGPEKYTFTVVADKRAKRQVANGPVLHLVLSVTDNGIPPLTQYRRVLVQVTHNRLVEEGVAQQGAVTVPVQSPGVAVPVPPRVEGRGVAGLDGMVRGMVLGNGTVGGSERESGNGDRSAGRKKQ